MRRPACLTCAPHRRKSCSPSSPAAQLQTTHEHLVLLRPDSNARDGKETDCIPYKELQPKQGTCCVAARLVLCPANELSVPLSSEGESRLNQVSLMRLSAYHSQCRLANKFYIRQDASASAAALPPFGTTNCENTHLCSIDDEQHSTTGCKTGSRQPKPGPHSFRQYISGQIEDVDGTVQRASEVV